MHEQELFFLEAEAVIENTQEPFYSASFDLILMKGVVNVWMFSNITQDQAARDKALQTMASMSSAQIVSASVLHNKALAAAGIPAFNNENQGYQVCSVFPNTKCQQPNLAM